MTEITQFYQVSALDLLSKTFSRGNPDGIKRKKKAKASKDHLDITPAFYSSYL